MKTSNYRSVAHQRTICIITDWFTTSVAFFVFDIFRYFFLKLGNAYPQVWDYILSGKMIMEQIGVPILLLFIYWLSGYYNRPFQRSRLNEFLSTLYSQLFNAIIIYMAALTNDQVYLRRENWMLLIFLFLILFFFTYIGRLIVTEQLIKRFRQHKIMPRAAVVGVSNDAVELARRLTDTKNNFVIDIKAFLPFGNEKENPEFHATFKNARRLNGIDELKALCEENALDQVIIIPPSDKSYTKKILYFLYHLYPYGVSIRVNPDILSLITPTVRLEDILGEPLIDLSAPRINEFSKNVKRTIDVCVSSFGLILLSPLLALLALGVRLSGAGPVIYSQERIGAHRKPFYIYKFRSMVPNAEKDGIPMLSHDDDNRITAIGRWMRKYRFDELPQFWNVLKGDMSLVGPRPERAYYIDKIVKKAPWYTLVLQVKPGITSWGMVKYGYATDIDQMIERNRYDLIYLSNMSIAVDFKILIHTIKTVSLGEGK